MRMRIFVYVLCEFGLIYVCLSGFMCFARVFNVFMNSAWLASVPQAVFFPAKKAFPDFGAMSILEIARIV